ncbi:hypothetical protein Lal_00027805 [Lupinus albus]|nr:hypothetical protein Lal_00027805 [Lupinus albus]
MPLMKPLTDKLASQLHQAARATSDLYDSPARRIIIDTHQVLNKALSLVLKCHAKCLFKRVFTIIPTNAFRKTSSLLENSTGDVSWLLRVSTPADDRADADIHLGLPPIAANVPILGLIWEQIAILCTGSPEDRSDAAASLVSIIRGNDRCGKLIMKEGGVGPLLKLIEEGTVEGQENGARAIGLLGCEHESVEYMVNIGFNMKGRELEDPETKASMKEMAARALWKLAKGNSQICRSITESKALNHLIP